MYLEIFLADFAVFRVFLGISRVRDRAKYQKPCIYHHQNCCSTIVYILTVEYVMSYFSETLIYM